MSNALPSIGLDELFKADASSSSTIESKSRSHLIGLILAGVTGGAAIVLSVVAAPFVAPALRKVCLPYVPASAAQVENVIAALRLTSARSVVDLGSGDGRLVLAACKELGVRGTGVELNPWLVLYSRYRAWRDGVSHCASFTTTDLWKLDLRPYDCVLIFGVQQMMSQLEHKLDAELGRDSAVVACRFPLPQRKPYRTIGSGIDTVWLYTNALPRHDFADYPFHKFSGVSQHADVRAADNFY
ncbi:ATP synthase subunit C lysine N-methyltransferase [Hyalella azteca]|uniref:ATP synthase subunit C lysine N-methyltransferase n=1 Tax=Hyalella azteca TaxID=294128 RepID=A0A8B7NZF7_HYAAZ|nr:ATP synthase subunit C lysine N-methyltransferase [Hyalella azteca]XP_047738851.1 ATP synthase subunit C lysine N-methyltransferase [Hyalella azteca]